MAFGMQNAPATFQWLINLILAGVMNCEAYLDDLLIFSETWEEHLVVLGNVFKRLPDARPTVNLGKCKFCIATVTYLGKQVGQCQVRPVLGKVQAIADFPVPTTRRELCSFLGMAGYYRGFCPRW